MTAQGLKIFFQFVTALNTTGDFEVTMQSYIVRIYRREGKKPERLLGVVEDPHGREKRAFTDYDELWEILNSEKKKLNENKRETGYRKGRRR
jgi:hypothetical protein